MWLRHRKSCLSAALSRPSLFSPLRVSSLQPHDFRIQSTTSQQPLPFIWIAQAPPYPNTGIPSLHTRPGSKPTTEIHVVRYQGSCVSAVSSPTGGAAVPSHEAVEEAATAVDTGQAAGVRSVSPCGMGNGSLVPMLYSSCRSSTCSNRGSSCRRYGAVPSGVPSAEKGEGREGGRDTTDKKVIEGSEVMLSTLARHVSIFLCKVYRHSQHVDTSTCCSTSTSTKRSPSINSYSSTSTTSATADSSTPPPPDMTWNVVEDNQEAEEEASVTGRDQGSHERSTGHDFLSVTVVMKALRYAAAVESMQGGVKEGGRLAVLEAELNRLDQLKSRLDLRAARLANMSVWSTVSVFAVQWVLMFFGTYYVFSWDIMEPLTYFLGAANAIAAYTFTAIVRKDYSAMTFRDALHKRSKSKQYRKHSFDLAQFVALRREAVSLKRRLKAIKELDRYLVKPLNQSAHSDKTNEQEELSVEQKQS
eukprot:GHVQ01024187.1.p1 GENE.GHVQ01024187.1~~GHVQ01024187.1.p1  ORF type:complete len:474 (+),score=94.78 GHVQ01024187.1:783-2204(+)